MKALVLTGLLLLGTWGELTHIRDRNAAVRQGATAYARADFAGAVQAYRQALAYGARDEAVLLNLAHALARAGRAAEARAYYGRLLSSRQASMRSTARQQLGVLAAARGDYAQALSQLRKALLAQPTNAGARYDYEAIKTYLDQHLDEPLLPPPAAEEVDAATEKRAAGQPNHPRPHPRPGNDHQGQLDDPTTPAPTDHNPQARPDAQGARAPQQPGTGTGAAEGSRQPGTGREQPVARGSQPGNVRGLSDEDPGEAAPAGRSRRAGSEAAAPTETQLQTQRERLQQMNLSSGQARQLLDALNAAEQQYLQQLPHKAIRKAEPGKPVW